MELDTGDPWRRVSRREAYRNPWISVDHDEVITPGGSPGIYGVVRFGNVAVGVVTLDAAGYTQLVGQFRYPLGRYSWEIPEGGAPLGTDPLDTARRELAEETGLRAATYTKLLELDLSNSVTDEIGVIYLAEGLTPGESSPEDTERLALRRVPFADAVALVLSGEIRDAVSVCGLLAAERFLRERTPTQAG